MNAKSLVLPSVCLGGAALLFAPLRPSVAFSKIGGSLGEGQRDVRVFDNFLDSTANNNVAPATQFPGYLGAELAVWKGVVEWGSKLHGDGTGDPLSGNLLGDGGADFDAFWSGNATGVGTTNNNIASSLSSCGGGGTLAFTETPISDGWRIRFCDEWTWDDGPGTISSRWDIQGVMAHEYGHALGLGHSAAGGSPTMKPSGSPGETALRSITADDTAGIQCIYTVADVAKPMITATVGNAMANTVTIHGMNFGATGNEVWFTSAAATATGSDPIVRVLAVSSSGGGTVITVTTPVGAGPGDVMINGSGAGGNTLSNAFPTDLVGTFGTPPAGPHPNITSVTPSSIEALIPGTAETVTIGGVDLDLTTTLYIDATPIASSRWTLVNPTTITLDMPQASSLGAHTLGAGDGIQTDNFPITIIVTSGPKLEWGNGDPLNPVSRGAGLDMILAGNPGEAHAVLSSPDGQPTFGRYLFDTKNRRITFTGQIPASGWLAAHVGEMPRVSLGATWFANSFRLVLPKPFTASNNQSITLVP